MFGEMFLVSSNLSGKVLQEVGTNAQVSGMCLLHADTSADLSERKRHEMQIFSWSITEN